MMSKPIAQIYEEASNLFQDKSRWAQGYYQRDKDGNECGWAKGYSFCAIGALSHFSDGDSHKALCCLQRVSEHLYGEHIQVINDSSNDAHHKVLVALKFAIELWTGREPTEEELGMSVKDLLEKRNATHT
jgi:hypothetical protein